MGVLLMSLTCGSAKLFCAEMVFLQPASSTHISTSSSGLPSLGVWVVVARADPDHGWKSDVGCGAAF